MQNNDIVCPHLFIENCQLLAVLEDNLLKNVDKGAINGLYHNRFGAHDFAFNRLR